MADTPTAPPVFAVVASEENKALAEQVMEEAQRVGKAGTAGDHTTAGLSYMFLAAMGAFGSDAQAEVRRVLA